MRLVGLRLRPAWEERVDSIFIPCHYSPFMCRCMGQVARSFFNFWRRFFRVVVVDMDTYV
jgi:hypothetical protein